ncbi:MAG: GNAT family N-acetyltransferase [Phycisphaerae bacterium]|nr:GNAT family N-acetyltransferase [Phycisphaerae bacterium]
MKDQIIIRDAIREDAPKLVQFNLQMARETEGRQLDERVLTSGIHAVLSDPKYGFYLVAEVDGTVAGSLMVTTEWSDWRDGVFWWIQSVYVVSQCRRRGLFRALYKEVTQRAKNTAKVCGCRLYVEQDNAAAQATYTKLGLVETSYKLFEELFS